MGGRTGPHAGHKPMVYYIMFRIAARARDAGPAYNKHPIH